MKRILICLCLALAAGAVYSQGGPVKPGTAVKKPKGQVVKTPDTPEVKAEKAKLAKLAKNSQAARAAMERATEKAKVAKLKKAAADAIMKEADVVLVTPALGPKEKYPKALRLYREVVRLDPKNAGAKEAIKTIESIYKQMGRPIPKDG